MIARFSPLDLALWSAVTALQLALALMVCSRGAFRKYPCFSAFVAINIVNHLSLWWAAWISSEKAYIGVSVAGSLAADIAVILTVAELWRRILGPGFTLPDWVLRDFVKLLITVSAVVGSVAFLVDMAVGPHPFSGFMPAFWTIDEIAAGAIVTALACVLIYAHSLHLSARRADSGIALGFVVCLLAELIADAARVHAGMQGAIIAQRVCHAVYCATLVIWARSVLYREPVRRLATLEEIREQSEKLLPIERELKLRA